MLIRLGFDVQFEVPSPVARISPSVPIEEYEDTFGNICSRFVAPAGKLQLYNSTLIEDSGDAADVAITTSFGTTWLKKFTVVTDEVAAGKPAVA